VSDVVDFSQNKSTWRIYPTMSVGERLQWLANLETYGPRNDFNYYNDDPFTEQIRAYYNSIVKDPALRSEQIEIDDSPFYDSDNSPF
jgi:hypothetical protein